MIVAAKYLFKKQLRITFITYVFKKCIEHCDICAMTGESIVSQKTTANY
jgi:hypothetical protein